MNNPVTTPIEDRPLRWRALRLVVLYLAVAVTGMGLGTALAQAEAYPWGLALLAGATLAIPGWLLHRWLIAPAQALLRGLQQPPGGPALAGLERTDSWGELARRCQELRQRSATLEGELERQGQALEASRRQAEDLRRELSRQRQSLAERQDNDQGEARQAGIRSERISQLLDSVNLAAAGDLTRQVPVQSDDAIGQVGVMLGRFLGKLRVSIAMIGNHAYSLDEATGQLLLINHTMNRDALDTSAQAGQAAAGARQVSRNLETVAGAAQTLNSSIEGIARHTQEAAAVAGAAVDTAGRTNATLASLARSSDEINNVVKLIGSIAGQTNLLALNATIEASRAGEAGRGFAVVASEVKDLARATARATQDITVRVQAIRNDAAQAIEAIGDISGTIGRISAIQQAITAAVQEQTETTRGIGRTVAAAADGGRDIAARINTVAAAAERTTAATQESRQAADVMTGLAAKLLELVGQFHYEMRGRRGAPPKGDERRGHQPPRGIGSQDTDPHGST